MLIFFLQQPYAKHRAPKRPSLLLDVGKHRSSNTGWKEADSPAVDGNELDERSREPTVTKMTEYVTTSDGKTIRLVEDHNSMAVDDVKRATLSGIFI